LLNNFDNRPGRLIPQPLSQPLSQHEATSQPQAGSAQQATSAPQAGSAQQDEAQCFLANNRANRPGFLQEGAQADSQPHEGATSQPQAGAAASQPQAGASQPQAGSAAQPESQPLLHRCPKRPAEAFAEVKAAKARASITGVITRRIVVGSKGLGIRCLKLKPRHVKK
jgi:hypothetical protein